jgi:phosphoribosylformimino-5-aminoimidazole carboxamide ribotide isomerase
MDTIKNYIEAGVNRVILGTSAVKDRAFLLNAVKQYGDKIAVGVDIKDGFVAIKGWTEKSDFDGVEFCKEMQNIGIKTIICTDISRDGAMRGTNLNLYSRLKKELDINIIASGGVTDISDIEKLAEIGVYGAIIGKAYYTGAIDISEAVEKAK